MVKAPILAKMRKIFQRDTIKILEFPYCGHKSRKNIQKKLEKIWRLRKSPYLCSPFERKRHEKFIEKIEGKYKKQVPRKYNLSRSVDSFERIESVSDKLEIYIKYTMKSLILAQDER